MKHIGKTSLSLIVADSSANDVFSIKTSIYTCLALVAFAGNSVLCRLALGENSIDAASFTIIRLLAGIITLMAIVMVRRGNGVPGSKGSWTASVMLFLYAITFSYAYISLDTATGALILFGSVQVTMILASLFTGTRLHLAEWAGVIMAFAGFVYLVKPGLSTPSATGFLLMAIAGIAWGFYTLRGRGSGYPLLDTAYNFLRTAPLVIILLAFTFSGAEYSTQGILLAIVSGALASGLGYAVWYAALAGLSSTLAAVVQLLVPVIAAAGGVIFAGESISLHFVLSSLLILGGILTVTLGRYYFLQRRVIR